MLDRAFSLARQATELAVKHVTALSGRALELAAELRGRAQGADKEPSTRVADAEARAEELTSAPARPRRPERAPAPPPPPAARPEPPSPPEPAHIEVEDELVGEFAEVGAEDAAGAEVEVAEPWPGYASLSAGD